MPNQSIDDKIDLLSFGAVDYITKPFDKRELIARIKVQVSKLFDRFYTVSNERRSTGIGLSIAKHLTEQMGGTISVSLKSNMLILTLKF